MVGLSWVASGVVIVAALWSTQGALSAANTYDRFQEIGFDKDVLAIGAAVALAAGVDIVGRLRTLARSASTAALLVLAEFVALGGVWLAMDIPAADGEGIWGFTPSAIVGALFGLWVALLLSLAQAIAAGMTALARVRGVRPYPENASWCAGIYAAGRAAGSQLAQGRTVLAIVKMAQLARPAPTPTIRVPLSALIRGLSRDWTGRWYLLCLASLPVVVVLGALQVQPRGPWILLYVPLVLITFVGFLASVPFMQALLGTLPLGDDRTQREGT